MRRRVLVMTPTEYERDLHTDRYWIGSKEYKIAQYGKDILGVFYHRGPKILLRLKLEPVAKRKD